MSDAPVFGSYEHRYQNACAEIEHLLQIRDDLMAQHTKALKVKDQKIKEAYFQGGQDMESKLLPTIEAKDQRITALEKAICDYVAADGAEPDTLLTDALSEDTRKEASREKA